MNTKQVKNASRTALIEKAVQKTIKAKAPKTPKLMFSVNDKVKRAVDVKPLEFEALDHVGKNAGYAEHAILMMLFANKPIPSFKDYQNDRTARGLSRVTSKSAGMRPVFQLFNNAAKIREAQDKGFNPLAHWNKIGLSKKRETEPTIQGGILQGAREFLNGKKETDHLKEFKKALKSAWKHANELPNNKANAQRVAKLVAIANADGITLEAETETEGLE